jgi:CheY-like chemotaxis protein
MVQALFTTTRETNQEKDLTSSWNFVTRTQHASRLRGRSKSKRVEMTFDKSLRQYSILCVDDDLIGLTTRAAVLEAVGYSVSAFSCPLMALKCDASKFHLAVLDFDMPGLNGFQLLLRLRAARATFPIVLLSGMTHDVPSEVRKLFSSCLDKGAPIHHLLDTVNSYLTSIPDPPECRIWNSSVRPLSR